MTGSVSDLGLRLMASAITAIFSLSLLFFLIYRLRQRKLRGRQNHLEAEGYNQDEILDDVPGHSLHLESLKPDDRVMMRRPFPPTYSEAMMSGLRPTENLGRQILKLLSVTNVHYILISDVSTEQDAPPYTSIHSDPVISYPVTSLGRLVLPAPAPEERPPASIRRGLRRAPGEQTRSVTEESQVSQGPEPLEDVRWEDQHPLASPPLHDSCQNRNLEPDADLRLTQTRV